MLTSSMFVTAHIIEVFLHEKRFVGVQDLQLTDTLCGDKYFHCKANCEASQRGQGGDDAAQCINDSREWFDQHRPKNDPPSASTADQVANQHSRTQGAANPGGICQQICAPFRPNGLPSQY